MTVADVLFIRTTFGLEPRDLARVLNVSPATVGRWESRESAPTGLQVEVLRALHGVALRVQDDEVQKQAVAGMIALGVGALIFYLLTREEPPCHSTATATATATVSTRGLVVDGGSPPVPGQTSTRVRVMVEFAMEIPGGEIPSPTSEVFEAVALSISGPPFRILPGASVTVDPE